MLSLGGNVPNVLHEVSVPIINKVKCQTMFTKSGHKKIVRDSFLCAGYDDGKKDSCEVSSNCLITGMDVINTHEYTMYDAMKLRWNLSKNIKVKCFTCNFKLYAWDYICSN